MQTRSPIKALTLQNQDLTEENNVLSLKLKDAEEFIDFLQEEIQKTKEAEKISSKRNRSEAAGKIAQKNGNVDREDEASLADQEMSKIQIDFNYSNLTDLAIVSTYRNKNTRIQSQLEQLNQRNLYLEGLIQELRSRNSMLEHQNGNYSYLPFLSIRTEMLWI